MPEVSRITYQFGTKPGNIKTMPVLRVEILASEEEGAGMKWKDERLNLLEEIAKILYVCPLCHAYRSTIDSHPTPCKLCGHFLMPFWEWYGREMLRQAAEISPIPTGNLKRAFLPNEVMPE